MRAGPFVIFGLLAVILGVPFALTLGRSDGGPAREGARLVVVTPHVPQIRDEFGHAFARWHAREFGEPAWVDFRAPGGTTEIRKQLEARYADAIKNGRFSLRTEPDGSQTIVLAPGTIDTDLMFGGGSYDHDQLRTALRIPIESIAPRPDGLPDEGDLRVPMSEPAGLTQSELDAIFGDNAIGAGYLYEPGQYWIGTALSSFGIVYNTDVLARLGVPEPDAFSDLTDPRLHGMVALADPRQSGSITTTFDSILGNEGWDRGWAILREMCGNARYFTNSATKPPQDVSQGDAAVGLAIDFYGRGQAQTAGRGRVGYTDPKGAVYIDADPISILRGGPNPELARRFLRFVLSDEGQALWQFHAVSTPAGADNPPGPDGKPMGPEQHELRRMPVRRDLYARHLDRFVDPVDPFTLASDIANPGWRTGVQVMMGCFGIDLHDACSAAWKAVCDAEADPGFPPEAAAAMRRLYHAWPTTPVDAEGTFTTGTPAAELPWTPETFRAVRNSWRAAGAQPRAEIHYTRFFRRCYDAIARLADTRSLPAGVGPETPVPQLLDAIEKES
jgi:ABC-type Fe3+ transport system substrate-binding protein